MTREKNKVLNELTFFKFLVLLFINPNILKAFLINVIIYNEKYILQSIQIPRWTFDNSTTVGKQIKFNYELFDFIILNATGFI